jgi:hypothetical protein
MPSPTSRAAGPEGSVQLRLPHPGRLCEGTRTRAWAIRPLIHLSISVICSSNLAGALPLSVVRYRWLGRGNLLPGSALLPCHVAFLLRRRAQARGVQSRICRQAKFLFGCRRWHPAHRKDEPTVRVLHGESRDGPVVEYAFRDQKPIGISTYRVNREFPEPLEAEVPAIEGSKTWKASWSNCAWGLTRRVNRRNGLSESQELVSRFT